MSRPSVIIPTPIGFVFDPHPETSYSLKGALHVEWRPTQSRGKKNPARDGVDSTGNTQSDAIKASAQAFGFHLRIPVHGRYDAQSGLAQNHVECRARRDAPMTAVIDTGTAGQPQNRIQYRCS
jgi:hypothetical protein